MTKWDVLVLKKDLWRKSELVWVHKPLPFPVLGVVAKIRMLTDTSCHFLHFLAPLWVRRATRLVLGSRLWMDGHLSLPGQSTEEWVWFLHALSSLVLVVEAEPQNWSHLTAQVAWWSSSPCKTPRFSAGFASEQNKVLLSYWHFGVNLLL